MGLIVLPQALKLVIPGIVNSFIALFKDTSLVLIIGLFDLLGHRAAVGLVRRQVVLGPDGGDRLLLRRADLLDLLLFHVALLGLPGAAPGERGAALVGP